MLFCTELSALKVEMKTKRVKLYLQLSQVLNVHVCFYMMCYLRGTLCLGPRIATCVQFTLKFCFRFVF